MRLPLLLAAVITVASSTAPAVPQAAFPVPDRRARLESAFSDIDRLFADFAKTAHVPGAAWGVIIDGELAHSGAAGVRETVSNAPVDVDTVFRIASMTKSFTAMAILQASRRGQALARRAGGTVRAGAQDPALSDLGFAADHHQASADPFRRFS